MNLINTTNQTFNFNLKKPFRKFGRTLVFVGKSTIENVTEDLLKEKEIIQAVNKRQIFVMENGKRLETPKEKAIKKNIEDSKKELSKAKTDKLEKPKNDPGKKEKTFGTFVNAKKSKEEE